MHGDDLIAQYIEQHPQHPAVEEARLLLFNIPVWAIIGYLQTPGADVDRVATDYDVPREAIEAAKVYYRRHRDAIDARIAANNAEAAHAL
jgi:uncharacterized protein (DUF433 family)